MNFLPTWPSWVAWMDQHWLIARLFFSCAELAVLAAVAVLALRLFRLRTPRLVALVWALVLAKPLLTLLVGSPLHLIQVPVPATETTVAVAALDPSESGAVEAVGETASRPAAIAVVVHSLFLAVVNA